MRIDAKHPLAALRPARKHEPLAPLPAGEPDRLAQLLGAVVVRNRYGEHLQVHQWYSAPEPFGAGPDALAPTARALHLLLTRTPGQNAAAHQRLADPAEWLFLDIETTGLAGGTGTYAFLVGLAWWEAGGLQVEQLFMRDHSEEHSLLLELSRRLAERRLLITFNGKSFDWPLLETRYLMTRAIAPRAPAAHLDLLHPARQLWRLRLGSVRLTELERHVLGPDHLGWDRCDDIHSALIPQIYFDYLRGAPPESLLGVFRHNQMDLRGLAALAGRIFALLSEAEATGGGASHALELYGVSKLLSRRGEPSKARLLYERALGAGLPAPVDRAARRELAWLAKRDADFARANALWEDLLETSFHRRGRACLPRAGSRGPARNFGETPGLIPRSVEAQHAVPRRRGCETPSSNLDHDLDTALEACEQLAIYYEHQAREHARAAELTRKALAELRSGLRAGRVEPGRYLRWQARLEHRLARLVRRAKPGDARRLFEADSAAARRASAESNQVRQGTEKQPGRL